MLTLSNMSSAQAAHYHKQDQNYYSKNGEIGQWQGKLAEELGLNGAVDIKHFEQVTQGYHPTEAKRITYAKLEERAGTDMTFSAPKSVSVLMELGGEDIEKEMRLAHQKAVDEVLQHIEDNYMQARHQVDGEREVQNTGNMIVAKFEHDTNREEEPQLHTHAFVVNMTKREDGKIVAHHNDELYKNKMLFGQIYRNNLAKNLKEMGYSIETVDAKMGTFEVSGVDEKLIKNFSTRSEQVKDRIKELKEKYPNKEHKDIVEMAKLSSRKSKRKIDRKEIRSNNFKEAEKIADIEKMKYEIKAQIQEKLMNENEAVNRALEVLTDKESVFSKEQLQREALKFAIGEIDLKDIQESINKNESIVHLENGLITTQEMIQIENEIVEMAKNGKNQYDKLGKNNISDIFKSHFNKYGLNEGQSIAVKAITDNDDFIINIQGDAGAGKTYMLKAAQDLKEKNYELVGLAYTGKAAKQIEAEAGIKSQTIDSFLLQEKHTKNQMLIVDEASLVGSKQIHKLMQLAKENNSKIVLLGDTKQFQTLSAGAVFERLQEQEFMTTVHMNKSLRAKTDTMKSLYQDIKDGNVENAFKTLKDKEMISEEYKKEQIIDEYLKDANNSLLIASNNKMREELNNLARNKLGKEGEEIKVRTSINLSDHEKHFATYYKEGEDFFANKSFSDFKAGTQGKILQVFKDENRILVEKTTKKGVTQHLIDLSKDGEKISTYKFESKKFDIGEQIIFTKNDKKFDVKNGETAIIQKIDGDNIVLKKEDGTSLELDLKKYSYLDYGYCLTDYKSQGQTTKKLIAALDANTATKNSLYVAITRAKEEVKIFTNDFQKLIDNAKIKQTKTTTIGETMKNQMREEELKNEELREEEKRNSQKEDSELVKYAKEKFKDYSFGNAKDFGFDNKEQVDTLFYLERQGVQGVEKHELEEFMEYANKIKDYCTTHGLDIEQALVKGVQESFEHKMELSNSLKM